jgi:hypothetical protein
LCTSGWVFNQFIDKKSCQCFHAPLQSSPSVRLIRNVSFKVKAATGSIFGSRIYLQNAIEQCQSNFLDTINVQTDLWEKDYL